MLSALRPHSSASAVESPRSRDTASSPHPIEEVEGPSERGGGEPQGPQRVTDIVLAVPKCTFAILPGLAPVNGREPDENRALRKCRGKVRPDHGVDIRAALDAMLLRCVVVDAGTLVDRGHWRQERVSFRRGEGSRSKDWREETRTFRGTVSTRSARVRSGRRARRSRSRGGRDPRRPRHRAASTEALCPCRGKGGEPATLPRSDGTDLAAWPSRGSPSRPQSGGGGASSARDTRRRSPRPTPLRPGVVRALRAPGRSSLERHRRAV